MGRKGGENMEKQESRQPNTAIAEVARIVSQIGEPFTFDHATTESILTSPITARPFVQAFEGLSISLQGRILEGIESVTFHPDGRITRLRRDSGH